MFTHHKLNFNWSSQQIYRHCTRLFVRRACEHKCYKSLVNRFGARGFYCSGGKSNELGICSTSKHFLQFFFFLAKDS